MVDHEEAAVAAVDPIYDDLKARLESAIKATDLDVVREIIESGFKYRYEKQTNFDRIQGHDDGCLCHQHVVQAGDYPAFLDSIAKGDFEMVTLVLKAEPDLDSMNMYGYGPLHLACAIKNHNLRWRMMKMLLDAGATVVGDGLPKFATTCVHQAVAANDFKLVKFLVNAGASLNCLDLSDRSLFHCTWMYVSGDGPKLAMVKNLAEAGADINIAGRKGTFLHFIAGDEWFSVETRWTMMKLLLDHGACLNILNQDNVSPLALAAGGDSYELVQKMIAAGADVNITKQCTGSPLQYAVSACNKDIVELLLKHGADIKVEDEDGKNILTFATVINSSLPNKSIEKFFNEGQNDYYVRKMGEYKDILKMILAYGVVMNDSKLGENMPFQSVLEHGNLDAMNLLIEKGVTLETCGVRFPLHLAASNSNAEVMQYLLGKHIYDVDALNDDGLTPLLIATRNRYGGVMYDLVTNGADVNIVCEEIISKDPHKTGKRTALSEAILSGSLREFVKPGYYHVNDVLECLGDCRLIEFLLSVDANMKSQDVYRTCTILADGAKANSTTNRNIDHLLAVIKCFMKQIVLLQSCNDPIPSRVEEHFLKQIPDIPEYINQCSDELEQLKTVILYGSTTLYGLLAGKDATCFINNQHVQDRFGSPDFYSKYPIYGYRLYNCVLKAQHKRKLMNEAKEVLNEILEFRLDNFQAILLKITSHLSLKDIINLCRARDVH